MKLQELKQWISESELVDSGGEYDSNGNFEGWEVYKNGGGLYKLYVYGHSSSNNHFCEEWGDKGCIRGSYKSIPVKKKKVVTYEYVETAE